MGKSGGPASRGETGHRRLGARVRYTNPMLPTLRAHGIIASARVGKYLHHPAWAASVVCISYGDVARARHALMMRMLVNSTPRIEPVSAALHCFVVLTTQSEIVPITSDASSNEQRANAQEQQEHPEAQPKQSPTSGVTQHHRLPYTCGRCARVCPCSSRK